MPTKEHRRHARGIVEALELRAHEGPSVCPGEIRSAREFLEQHDFSPASDYYSRLTRLQDHLQTRARVRTGGKRNYGGEAAGCWMQLQSVYDHVILSTCYDGQFNTQRGRVKISHRFNQAGRVDFVELKFLRSLQPCLTGEIRKLVTIRNYQTLQKDWHEAEAFVLRVLPRELVFLLVDFFRYPRHEIVGWLINLGHRTAGDLLADLGAGRVNGHVSGSNGASSQLALSTIHTDDVAMPILEQAGALESTVEVNDPDSVVVRYVQTPAVTSKQALSAARY
ncbi:MAG TPA: hypothetical protein VFZ59_14945 [Verrucomicrobiae bacterium]|nr:hypothetical protein [Verrucomicrobiae bacterium]